MRLETFEAMISRAAAYIPPPAVTQPENELRPDPATLRDQIKSLAFRVHDLENFLRERLGYDRAIIRTS